MDLGWLPQVLSLKNLFKTFLDCFEKMLQTFCGNAFDPMTIFVSGIYCNALCQHFQGSSAFLDARKA
jgi:hypothetical protein